MSGTNPWPLLSAALSPAGPSDLPGGGLIQTCPETSVTLTCLPSTGGGGGSLSAVVNVSTGPYVVPALFVATSRTSYSSLGTSPETDAETAWLEKSEPIACVDVN